MPVDESVTFTRSEEELSLEGRRVRTVKRMRLRKRIVEDWVEVRVPVRREELEVIEEEVLEGAIEEAPLSEQTLEIVLLEEEPVVTTRVVARERVTLTRFVVAGEQAVSERLRQEVIEVEELPPRE